MLLVLGACAPPPLSPTPTAPAPSPTQPPPSQPPPPIEPPTTPQPSEVPHYRMALVSAKGFIEGCAQNHFSGEIRNDSSVTLKDITAVVTAYDQRNNVVSTDWSLINRSVRDKLCHW